ncbi:MAG: hypothetical protein MIO92_05320 [Methanosarcinaceae archaeon]|nr:hypothetical protein [Methanosarcinaceae archaeon]
METSEDKRHWWQEDWTQEIGLIVIGIMVGICVLAPPPSTEVFTVAGTAIGAIGGYLTGKKLNENGGD